MSFVRSKLKYARESLAKKDYAGARDAVMQVLACEPDNYNAWAEYPVDPLDYS